MAARLACSISNSEVKAAMGKHVLKEMAKAYLKSIAKFIGARWISPRETDADRDCAVMEIEVDLTPDALNFLGVFLLLLAKHDNRVNTDHPVFQYLGQQAQEGQDAEVTFLISLKRRKAQAEKPATDV